MPGVRMPIGVCMPMGVRPFWQMKVKTQRTVRGPETIQSGHEDSVTFSTASRKSRLRFPVVSYLTGSTRASSPGGSGAATAGAAKAARAGRAAGVGTAAGGLAPEPLTACRS